MEVVDTGKDKVKKICDILRKETLEPAVQEAHSIVGEAKQKADQILENAKTKANKMIEDAQTEIEKRQAVFKASLNQGARQSIEWLKQEIEERFLNRHLASMIVKSTSSPEILAKMVSAVIKAIEDEGLETDLSAIIPSAVEARVVNELLGKDLLAKLKENSVLIGSKKGGIEMKLHKENITIDLTDTALLELMTRYIRESFRQFFFAK